MTTFLKRSVLALTIINFFTFSPLALASTEEGDSSSDASSEEKPHHSVEKPHHTSKENDNNDKSESEPTINIRYSEELLPEHGNKGSIEEQPEEHVHVQEHRPPISDHYHEDRAVQNEPSEEQKPGHSGEDDAEGRMLIGARQPVYGVHDLYFYRTNGGKYVMLKVDEHSKGRKIRLRAIKEFLDPALTKQKTHFFAKPQELRKHTGFVLPNGKHLAQQD